MAKQRSRAIVATAGPFLGVKDDTQASDPQFAQGLTNVVFADAGPEAGLVSRPGFEKHPLTVSAQPQGVFEHVASDGTRTKFVFADNKVYRWSWTSSSRGVSTFTDVTPAGVAISSTVSCVSFADTMIVTDGVNRPWKATNLSSTPITGAYLTGVPGAVTSPAVYYAKLFFIKADEQNTIIWSEEQDPDTGYESGGYNNAWTLGQTSNEPLVAIRATNEALYYWRTHSIGMITGAVDSEFVAAGVHDSISQTTGAWTNAGVVEADGCFYFADRAGRLHILTPGQGLAELWREMGQTTLGAFADTTLGSVRALYSPTDRVVLFAFTSNPLHFYITTLAVSTMTKHGLGVWSGTIGQWDAWGVVSDPVRVQRVAVLDGTLDGVFVQATHFSGSNIIGTWATDYDGTTSTYPDCSVVCPLLANSAVAAKDFQRLTVLGRTTETVRVDYETPRGTYGTAQTVTATGEGKAVVGINAQTARWIRPRVRTEATAGAFSFQSLDVQGVVITDAPGVA